MTEAAGLLGVPPDHQVVAVHHYEAGPPPGISNHELVEPAETFATTKEEEWVTKKKTEVTTTRQIETRVKRQVVLEDGKVVEDSGPIVTTNTTEDTEKQEHEQTEHRTLGDEAETVAVADEVDGGGKQLTAAGEDSSPVGKGWVAVAEAPVDGAAVVKEVKERRVLSREETEETRETEDVHHLGDITDEQFLAAVRTGKDDIRRPLRDRDQALVTTGPRLVHQTTRTHKTVDTEDTEEKSALQPDGRIVTETKRTTEHEETNDEDLSDDNASDVDVVNRTSSRHIKTKDQELVDYVADGVPIAREMRFTAETMEGERHGEPGMDDPQDWDSLSTRIRKSRRQQTAARNQLLKQRGLDGLLTPAGPPLDRKDAVTNLPLDFDQEEETRKVETSKWLEHHFGSESQSSKDSIGDDDTSTGPTTSYFNVTIKSKPNVVKPQAPSPQAADIVGPHAYVATVNSSAKTYTPAPEPVPPPKPVNGKYFQGVSEWSERRYEENQSRATTAQSPSDRYVKVSHHSSIEELDRASPRYANGGKYQNGHVGRSSPFHRKNYSDDIIPERESPFRPIEEQPRKFRLMKHSTGDYEEIRRFGKHVEERSSPYRDSDLGVPTPPQRKRAMERKQRHSEDSRYDSGYRSHSRNEMSYRSRDSKEDIPLEEPPPDYSPPPRVTPSPSPSPPLHGKDKKLYQRTRFAADIPPPKQATPRPSGGNIIGQSIRKLVGKIRSASAERKAKQKAKRMTSRSPSPHPNSPTYQQFNVIDNNIPPPVGEAGGRVGRQPGGAAAQAGADKQVCGALFRTRSSEHNMAEARKHQRGASPVQRYYLGEDPFGGSIYGRENKYDGVRPAARTSRKTHAKLNGYHHQQQQQQQQQRGSNPSEEDFPRTHSSTLGRFSKSTSRLGSNGDVIDYSRTAQTLPRNIHHSETSYKHHTNMSHSPPTRLSKNNNSNSTINVSIINTVSPPSSIISANRPLVNGGPAKPARTYKSSLSRSKSFNVHAGDLEPPGANLSSQSRNMATVYKSNPHLHRLDENPTKLKSPGIVSSISRSQRDINEAIIEEDRKENSYTSRFIKNGYDTPDKKKVFMKGLADRAPELFKTLHGNENVDDRSYSPNYTSTPKRPDTYRTLPKMPTNYNTSKNYENTYTTTLRNNSKYDNNYTSPLSKIESNYSSPGKHTVLRRGSNSSDNYSETYHITSKSDDPARPGITNTVKSFSKKTVPSKDGRSMETIESTETKTVTKSRYRGEPMSNLKYIENGGKLGPNANGGVVIEVRNNYRK